MDEQFMVKVVSSRAQQYMALLGTTTIPVDPGLPVPVAQHDRSDSFFYLINLKTLTNIQQQKIIESPDNKPWVVLSPLENWTKEYGIPAEEFIMERVFHSQIDLLREGIRQNRPEFQSYLVARGIISLMLGFEWTKNLASEMLAGGGTKRMTYLRSSLKTEQERYEHRDRLTR